MVCNSLCKDVPPPSEKIGRRGDICTQARYTNSIINLNAEKTRVQNLIDFIISGVDTQVNLREWVVCSKISTYLF